MTDLLAFVVDDDAHIRKLVRVNLEKRGYQVMEAANGLEAIRLMSAHKPDLVILDLVMPEMNGNEVCEWLRERWDTPIIVMSAWNEEELKVSALDSGADDYVTKPFGQEELMARVRALMRRAAPGPAHEGSRIIRLNSITVNLDARRAFVDNVDIHLTRTEFALLAELAQHLDSVLTHDELLERVWGDEYRGSSHYLHVYFGRIRKKIGEPHNNLLESVAGVGYILRSPSG